MRSTAEPTAAGEETAERYLEGLELFGVRLGLERMGALLSRLGHPERRCASIHVVGTNGKSSTARMTEAILAAEGLRVGTYLSPHVTGWSERIRVGGEEAAIGPLVARVRGAGVEGVTQFEALTAMALSAFAEHGVDVAVVEAGLGGRLDATNVLGSRVVVLTNVGLEHAEHLGRTREAIAGEKLAVVSPGAAAVLGEAEWEGMARERGAAAVVVAPGGNAALAGAAAEAFLGRPVDPGPAAGVRLPGRLEVRRERPLELWDGAHNPAGVRYLLSQLPGRHDWTLVASILADKDVDGMLALFSRQASRLVATSSPNARALPAAELARRARPFFSRVEAAADPSGALERARLIAGPGGAVLVSGSLYLLACLHAVRPPDLPWRPSAKD